MEHIFELEGIIVFCGGGYSEIWISYFHAIFTAFNNLNLQTGNEASRKLTFWNTFNIQHTKVHSFTLKTHWRKCCCAGTQFFFNSRLNLMYTVYLSILSAFFKHWIVSLTWYVGINPWFRSSHKTTECHGSGKLFVMPWEGCVVFIIKNFSGVYAFTE
jgi:hypothetical protein